MKKSHQILLGLIGVSFVWVLFREYQTLNTTPRILFSGNSVMIQGSHGNIFTHGDDTFSRFSGWFGGSNQSIEKIDIGKTVTLGAIEIIRATPHVFWIKINNKTLWLFTQTPTKTETKKLLAFPKALAADFWAIPKTMYPKIPTPKTAILFYGERSVSEKFSSVFSKTPLVSIKDTGGFLLAFGDNAPQLKTKLISPK